MGRRPHLRNRGSHPKGTSHLLLPKAGALRPSTSVDVSVSPKNQSSFSSPPAIWACTLQLITCRQKFSNIDHRCCPYPWYHRRPGLFKDLPPPKNNNYKLFAPSPPSPPSTKDKRVLPPPQSTSLTTLPLLYDDRPSLILPQELRKLLFFLMTTHKWYSIIPILN